MVQRPLCRPADPVAGAVAVIDAIAQLHRAAGIAAPSWAGELRGRHACSDATRGGQPPRERADP